MRAMSWRPALFLRKGTSVTLSSYFAAGSYLPAARALMGSPAAAPSAVMVCRKLRRCIGLLLRESPEFDLLAVVAAMVLLAAGGEDNVVAAHLAFDRHRALAIGKRAREYLERLLEREVALRQLVLVRDARRLGVPLGERDHLGVVLDAERVRAALCRGDHRAAVARAEIDDVVLRRHAREVEHLVDHRLRRRHPHDVLARLADFGLEGGGGRRALRLGESERAERDEQHAGG